MLKLIFVAMMTWHLIGQLCTLVFGPEVWCKIPAPICWLLGCTSFHDPYESSIFWSVFVAGALIVGLFAMTNPAAANLPTEPRESGGDGRDQGVRPRWSD